MRQAECLTALREASTADMLGMIKGAGALANGALRLEARQEMTDG